MRIFILYSQTFLLSAGNLFVIGYRSRVVLLFGGREAIIAQTYYYIDRRKKMVCEPEQESMYGVELEVNGKKIELNSFVQNFMSQSVIGMVGALRGTGEVEAISLKVSKKSK